MQTRYIILSVRKLIRNSTDIKALKRSQRFCLMRMKS